MGRGEIVSHDGDGLYTVKLKYNRATIDAEKARIIARIAEIDATEIPAVNAAITTALVAFNEANFNLITKIEATDPEDQSTKEAVKKAQTEQRIAEGTVNQLRAQLAQLKMEKASKQTRLDYINENVPETDPEIQAWCADLTEDLTGDVGTIEPPDESIDVPVIIRPGYTDATFDATLDGQLKSPAMLGPAEAFFNRALLPGVQRWRPFYRLGEITEIDGDACTVALDDVESSAQDLPINETTSVEAVVTYMECNGAAFEVGDRVVVMFSRDWNTPIVIGFESNPRACSAGFIVVIECKTAGDVWNRTHVDGDTYLRYDSVSKTFYKTNLRVYWDLAKDELFRLYRENGTEINQPTTEYEVKTECVSIPIVSEVGLEQIDIGSGLYDTGDFKKIYSLIGNLWNTAINRRDLDAWQWYNNEFNAYLNSASAIAAWYTDFDYTIYDLSSFASEIESTNLNSILGPENESVLLSYGYDTNLGNIFRRYADNFDSVAPRYLGRFEGVRWSESWSFVFPGGDNVNNQPYTHGGGLGSHCAEGLPSSDTYLIQGFGDEPFFNKYDIIITRERGQILQASSQTLYAGGSVKQKTASSKTPCMYGELNLNGETRAFNVIVESYSTENEYTYTPFGGVGVSAQQAIDRGFTLVNGANGDGYRTVSKTSEIKIKGLDDSAYEVFITGAVSEDHFYLPDARLALYQGTRRVVAINHVLFTEGKNVGPFSLLNQLEIYAQQSPTPTWAGMQKMTGANILSVFESNANFIASTANLTAFQKNVAYFEGNKWIFDFLMLG